MKSRLNILLLALALGTAGALLAQETPPTPNISLGTLDCLPVTANQGLSVTVKPDVGGTYVRLYFRWKDHGDFYYINMMPLGGGNYWASFPKPETKNKQSEYYVDVVEPDGTILAKTDIKIVDVKAKKDCPVTLTPIEDGFANNLTVGETVKDQKGKAVLGWLCDGIVTREDWQNILRPDDVCRHCVAAIWWGRVIPGVAVAGGVVTGVIIHNNPPKPASPTHP